ncbi:MAG: hypothetical protein NNA18_05635 [Nitrospira sp.]|nr:hypothetical protein [Nitrospira sp.]
MPTTTVTRTIVCRVASSKQGGLPTIFRILVVTWAYVVGAGGPAAAIVVQPTDEQIRAVVVKGQEVAHTHLPPDVLYPRFGEAGEQRPHGFLVTRLGSIAVMAAHMALRGLDPGPSEIAQILKEPVMLVIAVLWGDRPSFAVESYMVLTQGERVIKPVTVRFDGRASVERQDHDRSVYKAKVVGAFRYEAFDPLAVTTITVFPSHGDAIQFVVDFSQIE